MATEHIPSNCWIKNTYDKDFTKPNATLIANLQTSLKISTSFLKLNQVQLQCFSQMLTSKKAFYKSHDMTVG